MANVTALEFRNTVLTAFDTFWADRTQISVPNVPFDTEAVGDEWVRVTLLGTAEGQTKLSSSVTPTHFTREGTITIGSYVRTDLDTDLAYTRADSVLQWLENPGVANAVFTGLSSPIENGLDGAWWVVSVSANWLYITDRAA